MKRSQHGLPFAGALALGAVVLLTPAAHRAPEPSVPLSIAKIYWEYNDSANDLGVHVSLDGEDWKKLKITKPDGKKIFEVEGSGPYHDLGMTELFFEGAEPSLNEFPLADLLALFPEGVYEMEGLTVDGEEIEGEALFSHAIPDGPDVSSQIGANDFLRILWTSVTSPPPGFPAKPIQIVGYQVIVESFQLTLPSSATSVTVPPEFVAALSPGEHAFEVLAIDVSGNQTLTEGSFVK
jgi:hypothetical protein